MSRALGAALIQAGQSLQEIGPVLDRLRAQREQEQYARDYADAQSGAAPAGAPVAVPQGAPTAANAPGMAPQAQPTAPMPQGGPQGGATLRLAARTIAKHGTPSAMATAQALLKQADAADEAASNVYKTNAAAYHDMLQGHQAMVNIASGAANGMLQSDSQAGLDHGIKTLLASGVPPEIVKLIPPTWGDEARAAVKQMLNQGEFLKTSTDAALNGSKMLQEALTFKYGAPERIQKGVQAIAQTLEPLTPEQRQGWWAQNAKNLPQDIVSGMPSLTDPNIDKTLHTMAVGSAAATTEAGSAAARTETKRHNLADEKNAAERLKLSGGTGADPEQVAAWVRQLRDPNSGIVMGQVPTAMRTAVVKQLQAGEIVKLTQQSQAMKETANSVIPIVTKVKDLADQIQKLDLMGTLGGRWRSLISRESSASSIEGLTPAQKQLVGQFITESGLLVSGVAKAHGGARGGGSIQMVEQLKPLLDPGNKDLDTYLGNLNGAMDVLNGYAHMGESGGGTQPPPSAAEIPANVQAALKGQPAGKHTLSDGSVWQIDAKGAISPVPKGGG